MNTEPFSINSGEYATIFQQFILRTLEALLVASQTEGETLTAVTQQRALRTLDFALNSVHAQGITGKLLVELSPKMEKAGLRDEWISYLQRAIEQCTIPEQQAIKAELLHQIGFLYQLRARYSDSVVSLRSSIDTFSSLKMTTRQAQVLFRLAYVNRLMRNYPESRQLLKAAFDLMDASDPLCAQGYYLRGLLAYDDGDYATAIQEYEQSLHCYEAMGDQRMIALRMGNIGLAFSDWRQFDNAINYLNRSISIFEYLQDTGQASVMKMNIGNVYLLQGQPIPALTLYEEVEPIFRKIGDELHLTFVYLNIGIACRLARQCQRAERYLIEALERWKQWNDIHSLVNTLDELALLYIEQDRTSHARSTLHQALDWLQKIEQQTGYQQLHQRVTKHLNQLC